MIHPEISKSQDNILIKIVSNLQRTRDLTDILLIIGLLVLAYIIFYYNSKDINLKIAYQGYGPQDYVAQKIHTENFQKDFAPRMLLYDNSIPMRGYYYLAKYFGISPTTTMYPYMFIQTLLFLLSVAFVTQTLFQNKFVTGLSVVIISLSNLAGLNLSRFGAGFSSLLSFPLFYGYSNAFRFFAFGFFLKNRYVLCFVFLALSIYCHVNMGLFALAFIGAYMIYKPRLLREKSFIAGIFVFLVLVALHILSIISNASISSGGIPVDQWVKSTRFFSHHWYPIKLEFFTARAHKVFFPFLLSSLFFFVALRYQDIKNDKNVKIIVGSTACLIMSLLGIIFSDIYPIPFLIKISFQRATGLITFFGVLYLIYYLFRKLDSGNIFAVFLASYSLLVFVFSKPGIAILPLFLLLYSDIKDGYFGLIKISSNKIKTVKYFYYTAAILLMFLTLTSIVKYDLKTSSLFPIANSIFMHLWRPLQYLSPFHGFDFLLRGGEFKVDSCFIYLIWAGLSMSLIITFRLAKNRVLKVLFIGIFSVMCLTTVWYLERAQYLRWHNRYYEIASSYLDVQLWAKNNTPKDALFMPDPAHNYGWRDFSERSSFGNLREWGYCAIAYNPDYKIYQEGIKRMKEFGIDFMEEDFKIFINSYVNLRRTFYTMKTEQLRALSRKYNIDYVIMNRRYYENKIDAFKVAYENKCYIVYEF